MGCEGSWSIVGLEAGGTVWRGVRINQAANVRVESGMGVVVPAEDDPLSVQLSMAGWGMPGCYRRNAACFLRLITQNCWAANPTSLPRPPPPTSTFAPDPIQPTLPPCPVPSPPTALCKDPLQRPTCLEMVHHSWIEMFRARRSMRLLQAFPQAPPGTPCSPAGHQDAAASSPAPPAALEASSPTAAQQKADLKKALKFSATQKQIGHLTSLQRVEAMLADESQMSPVTNGINSGVQLSAASSPCLGSQGVIVGQLAAGVTAVSPPPKITALGQLSRLASPAAGLIEGIAAATLAPVPGCAVRVGAGNAL